MTEKLGRNIRELRRKCGMSQEMLAGYLGVSAQAVSKWENGLALPDITHVPRLAACFGVSTDELFAFDSDKLRADIERIAAESFGYRETDPEKGRRILEEGLRKYPENDILLNNMLYVMNYTADPDSTIAMANRLIARTRDSAIRYDALRFLAYAHHARGDDEAAVQALEQVPEMYFSKLSEMAFITTGQRKRESAEKQKWISFEMLIQMQWKLAECREEEGDISGAIACARKAIKLIEALAGDPGIEAYDTYLTFFENQISRLEGQK